MMTYIKGHAKNTKSNEKLSVRETIKNLIIIGGEKGGVGKSFFTRYLLAHIVSQKGEKEIICYDADPSVDDVYQIFKGQDWMRKAHLSEDKFKKEEAYKIFENKKPTVIVNLPSNIARNFDDFCEKNSLFDEEALKDVSLYLLSIKR